MEGLYSKWPRIDKELILQYHEGLIATTCCLAAEVPRAIMKKSKEEAEDEADGTASAADVWLRCDTGLE